MQDPMDYWIEELQKLDREGGKMTEKQSKIIQAAVEVFSEKGFAASSTNEIAQKAGVAEGTIFRHYKTKRDLLLSIVAPVMTKLVAPFVLRDFHQVLSAKYDRFDQFLRALILNRIEFLDRHMNVFKIFLQEVPFQPELQEQFKKLVVTQVLSRVKPIIAQFQEDGQLMKIPVERAIRMMVSSIMGYVMIRSFYGMQAGEAWDDELEREETIRFIIRGLQPEQDSPKA